MPRSAPPSRVGLHHIIFLATLALLLSRTLATSASAAESGDPCAVSVSDGGGDTPSCPVRCFRPDPVCGADGVTYWCGCSEAACAGARVAKRGFCEVGARLRAGAAARTHCLALRARRGRAPWLPLMPAPRLLPFPQLYSG
ncbi:hypothetical protein PR202_gb19012 [Eleusine coracana subsp. coracana]|uniref:Uncharacterized protein n=1 Tax=Eleusine coracana subsp. coracana TaxID=191504 RepID=A0AAV5F8I5_ELECO|nr:hypothetical protein PR202_gb19012 [Eleusine coracana subsp. coracana]